MKIFPVIDISDQKIDYFEQMGTKSKFWFTNKVLNKAYLFKSTHTEDKEQKPIIRLGENWSEKVACEIAGKLGIPHAKYDLATYNGQVGTISENFCSPGDELMFGNDLIERVVKSTLIKPIEKGQQLQTVLRVSAILQNLVKEPPKKWIKTENINTALDVFIGYIMLDTLISNQDRHSENWAMITDKFGNNMLAPSFDHAASLGRNETDCNREIRLHTHDKGQSVKKYVSKCKSHFYSSKNRLKMIEAFIFFGYRSPDAGIEWLERLEKLDVENINGIFKAIPNEIMSDTSKLFSLEMIKENRLKLLESKKYLEDKKNLESLKNMFFKNNPTMEWIAELEKKPEFQKILKIQATFKKYKYSYTKKE